MAKYVVTLQTEVEIDAASHSEAHVLAEIYVCLPPQDFILKATYSKKVTDEV